MSFRRPGPHHLVLIHVERSFMKKIIQALSLLAIACLTSGAVITTLLPNQTEAIVPAFYVAVNGNDSNAGTLALPFLTLGRCQTAMRGGSVKVCYIRAGLYNALPRVVLNSNVGPTQATVMLTSSDDGETWSYYPPDGYNNAILDGNSTGLCENTAVSLDYGIWADGASNITINGLYFQNFTFGAIGLHGGTDFFGDWFPTGDLGFGTANNITIKNNIMNHINNGNPTAAGVCTSPAWPPPTSSANASGGGVAVLGRVTNLTITHNAILNTLGMGMDLEMFSTADTMDGLTISYNVIYGANTSANDTGCIHLYNYTGTGSNQGSLVGTNITNNYLHDCGGSGSSSPYGNSRGVYLDDGVSGVVVSGNVVAGHMETCFNYHGGNNNTVSGNICDLGDGALGTQIIWLYQDDAFCSGAGCMANNIYRGNIVISNASIGMGGSQTFITGSTAISASNDLSHTYNGTLTDTASVATTDPQLTCWTYKLASGSPAYNSPISFPTQPANYGQPGYWGPPNFTIPQTGTVPSSSHTC